MLSKRDLQLVRLAVRWKWINAEQGEDLLFLKRKFGGKLSIEEIIRRRGYIDDDEIPELSKAADELVGRTRPRPVPKPRRPSATSFDPNTTTARGPAPVPGGVPRPPTVMGTTIGPPPREPTIVPRSKTGMFQRPGTTVGPAPVPGVARPATIVGPAPTPAAAKPAVPQVAKPATTVGPVPPKPGTITVNPSSKPAAKRPAITHQPEREPIEAPSTKLTLIDDHEEQPLPDRARRVLPPDRAATVLMQVPLDEDSDLSAPKIKDERPTEWMARAYSLDRDTDPPLSDADVSDELSALAPATIVTALPQHVLEALQREDGPEDERTAIADPRQLELLRRWREDNAPAPVPKVSDVPVDPRREPRGRRATMRGGVEQKPRAPVPIAPSVERAQRAPTLEQAPPPELDSDLYPSIAQSIPPVEPQEISQPVELRFDSVTGRSSREVPAIVEPAPMLPPVTPMAPMTPGPESFAMAPREMLDDAESTVAPEDLPLDLLVEGDEEAGVLSGQLGQYFIERVIARGRRGVLYRARAPDGSSVALKVIAPEAMRSHTFLQRMYDAAERGSQIDSPYVVPILDAGNLEGNIFFAVEYVDAWTLEERLDSGDRPGLLESLRIARDVARALEAASQVGVVHRDVNPDAILIGRGGEARLTGFAMPKELTVGTAALSAGDTPIYGTAGYMAPEQVLGSDVDARADLYALGATLFHLVTGRRVFEGNDATAILAMVTREAAPKTRDVDPAVPEVAAAIIDRLLALHRDERFRDASELIAAFDAAISKLEISEAEGARVAQLTQRRTMILRTAGLSAAILTAVFLLSLVVVRFEIVPWTASRFLLHEALAGAGAVIFALVLASGLALVRRGELPLPMSSAWLVRLQDGAGAVGAALLAGGLSVAPGAILNVAVSLIAGVVFGSWIYGILLRQTIAHARPDRGVGRMLAVLGDPNLARWRFVHMPLLATLALLATARWAFLAYFAASAGL